MYLPSNTPLLGNQRPDTAREAICSDNRIQAMRRTSAKGRAQLFNTLVSPDAVTQTMGTGASLDVARMQQQTETSRATGLLGTSVSKAVQDTTMQDIIRNAPEVVSLNRGGGCQKIGQAPKYQMPPDPMPTMPKVAPQIVNTPQGPLHFEQADTPQWNNLCWALRNGAVDQSQFNPDEFLALMRRCTEQGYVGACAPPTNTERYLDQNRRAGTLPHISVSPDVLAGMPHAPENIGGCENSYQLAGLTGYAPPWSDAWVTQAQDSDQGTSSGVSGWISDHPWLSLAIAGAGVFALSRRSGR